jgi:hypothetical protein
MKRESTGRLAPVGPIQIVADTGIDMTDAVKVPRKGRGLLVFTIGFVLGVVAVIIARPFLGERLPQAVGGKRQSVAGPVTAKQQQGDRLLLTINTADGAILGTFTRKVDEISLLVERGDTVTLTIPAYEPFLENPVITRVGKPTGIAAIESGEPGGADVETADSLRQPADTLQKADSTANEQTSRWYD